VTEECQSTIAELTRQKTDNVTLIARHLVNGNHLQSVSRLIVPAETLGLRKKCTTRKPSLEIAVAPTTLAIFISVGREFSAGCYLFTVSNFQV